MFSKYGWVRAFLNGWGRKTTFRRTKPARGKTYRPLLEVLESRLAPAISVANSFLGLDFNASSVGAEPPDTQGAVSSDAKTYVTAVNQSLAINAAGTGTQTSFDSFTDFWFKQGKLKPVTTSSFQSDCTVNFDEQIQRFIVGDLDVDVFATVFKFDIAVSKSAHPATLTAADWNFFQFDPTEVNQTRGYHYFADYPGNVGYNHDALVITLQEFGIGKEVHVQVNAISLTDLVAGNKLVVGKNLFQTDINGMSVRPTVMHDSVAVGDPMWLLQEHRLAGVPDNTDIDVIRMTNVLSATPKFTTTILTVNSYLPASPPQQPDGSVLTFSIDSRIMNAGERNGTLVAAHIVGNPDPTQNENDSQWYNIDVSSGTPNLVDQGDVSAGANTFDMYPSIDINQAGEIGMSFIQSGLGAKQFLSMFVTGRLPSDPAGTMQTPVLIVPGIKNYTGSRLGDLGGINVDQNGFFWTIHEFANDPKVDPTNWGTAVAQFAFPDLAIFGANKGLTVAEGRPITVDSSMFQYTDDIAGEPASDIIYTLTAPPAHGTLTVSGRPLGLGDSFTQDDINNGFIRYNNNGDEANDGFTVSIVDGIVSHGVGTATFSITIHDLATLSVNTGILVNNGATVTITNSHLASTDDTGVADLNFTLLRAPAHGTLDLNGTPLDPDTTKNHYIFTQDDINNGKVTYTHSGDGQNDSFDFGLYDGPPPDANYVTGTFTLSIPDLATLATNAGLNLGEGATAPITSSLLLATDDIVPPPAGSFDTSFNGSGKVISNFTGDKSTNILTDTAVQTNGQIVAVGGARVTSSNEQFAIARFNADGSLDTNFGNGGRVTTDFGQNLGNEARAVIIQSDGKIVVGGITNNASLKPKFALARYNTDGSLDGTFGNAGLVVTDLSGPGAADTLWALALQADGKIVAAGQANTAIALVRYNADGSLDTGFGAVFPGTGGIVTTPVVGGAAAHALVLQTNGKIVVGGGTTNGNDFVGRYNTDGTPDTGFGATGIVVSTFGFNKGEDVHDVAVQHDGKIVTAGFVNNPTSQIALVRYNTDGSLDSTFGTGGMVQTNLRSSIDAGNSLALQSNGKILVAGASAVAGGADSVVVRYNADGSLDTKFGSGGSVITNYAAGADDQYTHIFVQTDGQIVAAGGFGPNFVLAKLNPGPATDPNLELVYTVTTAPAHGKLKLNGNPIKANSTFTQLDINNGNLTYTQDGTDNFDAFDFSLIDALGPGSINGTFNITTGDVPSVTTNGGLTLPEGGTATITSTLLKANDDTSGDPGTDLVYTVTTAPTQGNLMLNGTTIGLNSTFTQDDINNGKLTYNHTATSGPDSNDSFHFRVTDAAPNGGLVVTDISGTSAEDILWGLTLQSDGKIVGVGTSGSSLTVVRYNSYGSLDIGFGNGGVSQVSSGFLTNPQKIAIQPDGKIVVAGGTGNGKSFVARFNSDGSLDDTFGSGGVTITSRGPKGEDIRDLALQPDGKIVTTGLANGISLMRFNPDGSLDSTFGSGGKVETQVRDSSVGNSVTVQADGKIIVAGSSGIPGGQDALLVRYNSNGSVDTTFGSNGLIITNYGPGDNDQYTDIIQQPDGKIVAGGYFGSDWVVARLSPSTGSFDSTFGTGGQVIYDFGGFGPYAVLNDIALQADGKVVAVGLSNGYTQAAQDMAVARFNSNGSLDTTFGKSGYVTTDFGFQRADQAQGVAIQADGKIVAGGHTHNPSGLGKIAIARYNSDGSLDTSFGVIPPSPTGVSGTFNITVADTPTLTHSTMALTEAASATITTSQLSASDDSSDPASELIYTVTTTPTHGTLKLNGTALAANSTFTQDDINKGNLSYANDGTENANDSIQFAVTDGFSANALNANFVITVIDQVAVSTNTGMTTGEGITTVLISSELNASDDTNSDPASDLTYTITTAPVHGTLKLNNTALAANGTFTQDDINNGKVTYTQDGSENFSDSFQFAIADGTSPSSAFGTFNITVNDLPTLVASALTLNEGASATITKKQLQITDDTATDPASELVFTVASTPAHGTLFLNSKALAAHQTFTQDDINNNRLSYTNDGNDNASDGFNFVMGESSTVTAPGSFTITINDLPGPTTNNGLAVAEGATQAITSSQLQASEGEESGDPASDLVFTVVAAPTHGSLLLNSTTTLLAGGTFTQDDINNGRLTYQNSEENDSFTFTVSDGNGGVASAQAKFAITSTDPAVSLISAGSSITGTEGTALVVATFTDPAGPEPNSSDPGTSPDRYTATIQYGNNQTATATLANGGIVLGKDGKTFSVYLAQPEEGTYNISTSVTHEGGTASGPAITSATVSEASLQANGQNIGALEGAVTGLVTVATFTDLGGPELPADYSATIDWGDSQTSSGAQVAIVLGGDGKTFSVQGNHVYSEEGSRTIKVHIVHEHGIFTDTSSTAVVADNQPIVTASMSGPGSTLTINVNYSDTTQENHTLNVDWADGTTSTIALGNAANGTTTTAHVYPPTFLDPNQRRWHPPGQTHRQFSGNVVVTVTDDEGTSSGPVVMPLVAATFQGSSSPGISGQNPSWQTQVGNFAFMNQSAVGTGGLNLATNLPLGPLADVSVTADLSVWSGQFAGLVTRYNGPGDSNMDFGVISSNPSGPGFVASIWRNLGGSWAQLSSFQPIAGSGQGTLRFDAHASALKLYWEQLGQTTFNLVGTASDSVLGTGSAGIRTSAGASLADFVDPPATQLPFSDNFAAGTGPVSQLWLNKSGAVGISNGAATGLGSLNLAIVDGVSQADVAVEAGLNVAPGQWAGVAARYAGTGDSNMYFGALSTNPNGPGFAASIWRNLNGNWSQLTPFQSVGASGQGTLHFEVVGTSLKLFWEASGQNSFTLVGLTYDTALTTGTVGMRLGQGAALTRFTANPGSLPGVLALPFNEDFTQASYPNAVASQLSRNWLDRTGNIAVVSGAATGNGGVNVSVLNGVNQANVAVQAGMTLTPGLWSGLVARYGGPAESNMYFGVMSTVSGGFQAQIYLNKGGNWSLLTSGQTVSAGSGTLEFEAAGSSLKLFWNNVLVASTYDSTLTTGSVGIRAGNGAALKNFQAKAILTNPALTFNDDFSSPGDGAQLNSNWLDRAGNITIVGGAATGTVGTNVSIVNGLNQADVAVQADMTLTAGLWTGLAARYGGGGDNNMYFGVMSQASGGFQGQIWRNLGGNWSMLTSGKTVSAGMGTLEFEVVGSSLKLFWNNGSVNALVAYTYDTTLTTGSVGIREGNGAAQKNFQATAVNVTQPPLAFNDNFSSPSDGAQLSHNWQDQMGNFTIQSGAAIGTGGGNVASVAGVNKGDMTVQADLTLGAGNWGGLVARYGGPGDNNMYLAVMSAVAGGQQASIWRNLNGTWSLLATGSTVAGGTGTLKFNVSGTSLKMFWNNILVDSATDFALTSGTAGLRAGLNAAFRNFSLT